MALQMESQKPSTRYEIEQVYHKDDSSSMDVTTTSPQQLCSMLDNSIRDVREKKKTIVTTMELVNRLMEEVEKEEKAAQKAKEETNWSGLDILAKVEDRKQTLLQAQEANNMLAEKLNAEKDVLTTKVEVLRGRVTNILDDEDRSLDILNKMCTSLELRLESALTEKDLAFRKKEENACLLAYHEDLIEHAVEEYHRLKEETLENTKLQKILDDRHQSVDMLHEEISDKFKDVKLIKEGVDPSVPLPSSLKKLEENKNVVAAMSEGESKKIADTDNRKAGAYDIHLINEDRSEILEEVELLLSKNLNSSSLEKPKKHKNVAAVMTKEPKASRMKNSATLKSTIKSNYLGEKAKSEINGLEIDWGLAYVGAVAVSWVFFMLYIWLASIFG